MLGPYGFIPFVTDMRLIIFFCANHGALAISLTNVPCIVNGGELGHVLRETSDIWPPQ